MNTNMNNNGSVHQEKVLNVQQEENPVVTEKVKVSPVYTPRRFSVRSLRKHTGIQTSRNPRIAY